MTEQWEVIYDHGWHVVDVTDKRLGGQILICDCGIDQWSEMNARKIAAAPELVEALAEMIAAMVDYEMEAETEAPASHREMMRKARAALAKAGAV